jgi:hypothetical protein
MQFGKKICVFNIIMDEEKIELREMLKTPSSPNIKKRQLEHKIQIEDKKYEDTWQSCCFQLDRRAVRFFSQFTIAILIIAFCIVQLVRNESCESQALYSGLLMTVIGIMLPSPSLH